MIGFVQSLAVAVVTVLLALSPSTAFQLRAPGGGAIHALVMGINDYPRLPGHSLAGARQDAEDIAASLVQGGVRDLQVLRDGEVTRATVIANMERIVSSAKPGDLVIVTYAGHGMQTLEYPRWSGIDENGVNEQIALSGFNLNGPGAGEIIVNEEVRAWLARLDARRVDTLVAWDSCFGGGMRTVAPGGGDLLVRQLDGAVEATARSKFTGIPMTDREARADVTAMSHVTFLAGATGESVVPEMPGVDPRNPTAPRGALSYFLARALEGGLKRTGEVARSELFPFLKQGVGQATAWRQIVQLDPQSADKSISGRAVFAIAADAGAASGPATPSATANAAPAEDPVEPVRLAIINGPSDAFEKIEKSATPIVAVAEVSKAELVWDVAEGEAIAQSDVLMRNVDASMIGPIADRVRALTRLRRLAEGRPLEAQLSTGGQLLTAGMATSLSVADLRGERLVVFDIGADATLQLIYPAPPNTEAPCADPQGAAWKCRLEVGRPFGVDTLVAVATKGDATKLVEWLQGRHGRRDAAEIPSKIGSLFAADPEARAGFVQTVTRASAFSK